MKKSLSIIAVVLTLTTGAFAYAEKDTAAIPDSAAVAAEPSGNEAPPEMPEGETPPDKPDGEGDMGPDGQTPPDKPDGEGDMGPDGQTPPDKPDGEGGMVPGGQSGQPEEYASVETVEADAALTGTIESTGTDENAVHVASGKLTMTDAEVIRTSEDSTGGDSSSFYGVGAAVLVTGGEADISDSTITTDAAGGAGVFAYGDGVATISDSTIETRQNTSGGIHVAGGGTLFANNLNVTTYGESSAAIRSDRGSGVMVVDGGTYTSNGVGSPAVYVTADITIHDADLTASGSEALCLEGLNSVRLYDCRLSGAMADLDQNDNTWTVILYQSMSGDSEIGKGRFEMSGGTLTSSNGGLFYTTNTESEFVLSGVEIAAAEDSEYFLRCTGNANQRGWGQTGANGADCKFTAIGQAMNGDVIWDSISNLDLYVSSGSELNGAILNDESYAGEGGEGACNVTIDASSRWVVTADSALTSLSCEGEIVDADGNAVSIVGQDGTVYVQGSSSLTVTVSSYSDTCDLTELGVLSSWEEVGA